MHTRAAASKTNAAPQPAHNTHNPQPTRLPQDNSLVFSIRCILLYILFSQKDRQDTCETCIALHCIVIFSDFYLGTNQKALSRLVLGNPQQCNMQHRQRLPFSNDKALLHIFVASAFLVAFSIILVPLSIENDTIDFHHNVAKLAQPQEKAAFDNPLRRNPTITKKEDKETTDTRIKPKNHQKEDPPPTTDNETPILPEVPYHVVFSTGCKLFQGTHLIHAAFRKSVSNFSLDAQLILRIILFYLPFALL